MLSFVTLLKHVKHVHGEIGGMKRLVLSFVMLAGGVLVLVPVWVCGCCPTSGTIDEWHFRYRIKPGMTLAEVESILGAGTKEDAPSGSPDYKGGTIPTVEGDEFYTWQRGGYEIWIGFKDERVHDKDLSSYW